MTTCLFMSTRLKRSLKADYSTLQIRGSPEERVSNTKLLSLLRFLSAKHYTWPREQSGRCTEEADGDQDPTQSSAVERVLTNCITSSCGRCSGCSTRALQQLRVSWWVSLPSIQHTYKDRKREIALCCLCPSHWSVAISCRLARFIKKQPECATMIQLSLCLLNSIFFFLPQALVYTFQHHSCCLVTLIFKLNLSGRQLRHSVHTGITGILQSLMPTVTPAYVLFFNS